jgi:hypothetical protein
MRASRRRCRPPGELHGGHRSNLADVRRGRFLSPARAKTIHSKPL